MRSADPCPRCGEEVSLVDPSEDIWSLDASDFEEDARVWFCLCGWHEEATDEEVLEDIEANLTWLMERLS